MNDYPTTILSDYEKYPDGDATPAVGIPQPKSDFRDYESGGRFPCRLSQGVLTAVFRGDRYTTPLGCGSYDCPDCSASKANRLVDGFMAAWERDYDGLNPILITLTFAAKRRGDAHYLAYARRKGLDYTGIGVFWDAVRLPESDTKSTLARGRYYARALLKVGELYGQDAIRIARMVFMRPNEFQYMLTYAWGRVVATIKSRYKVKLPYLAVPELTEQGVPHLHVVAPDLPALGDSDAFEAWLSELWLKITGDSHVVDVSRRGSRRQVKHEGGGSLRAALWYAAKYISKGFGGGMADYMGEYKYRRYRVGGFTLPTVAPLESLVSDYTPTPEELEAAGEYADALMSGNFPRKLYKRVYGRLARLRKLGRLAGVEKWVFERLTPDIIPDGDGGILSIILRGSWVRSLHAPVGLVADCDLNLLTLFGALKRLRTGVELLYDYIPYRDNLPDTVQRAPHSGLVYQWLDGEITGLVK